MNYTVNETTSLMDALAIMAPKSTKNTLRSWIKEGRVLINGEVAKNSSIVVEKGQIICVGQRKKMIRSGLPIIFEDDDLVIVNKPSGLLSVSTAFEKGETVHALLKAHYYPRKIFVVHRLDQDTSGVMVFAFNQRTLDKLKELFAEHDIERSYTAIVEGELKASSGTWKSFQYEDKQYFVHETQDQHKGRLAVTHFRRLGFSRLYSWLELTLETGRKNQIRVHCQNAGHSVVGDKKYGSIKNPIKRLCLHAHLLGFQHPTTKKKVSFEAPIPTDFYKLVKLN